MRTEIYINRQKVDLKEEIPMAFTYAIADITKPEKRNTSYSKTLTIPGSKGNNILFGHIFELSRVTQSTGENFAPDFNPNLKADCLIYVDNILQFKGIVQLLDIKNNGGELSYEITVKGPLADIFSSISNLKVQQLDFSEYDHDYTFDNVKNSWDTKIKKNGADYTNFNLGSEGDGSPIGEGYVYPLIDFGLTTSPTEYFVRYLNPAIYLKTIVDKIFSFAGFSYDSEFFNSSFFKRLIIPYTGEPIKLTEEQINQRKFKATNNADQTILNTVKDYTLFASDNIDFSGIVLFQNDSTGGNYDIGNRWVNPNWTVHKRGIYNINAVVNHNIFANVPTIDGVEGSSRIYVTVQLFNITKNKVELFTTQDHESGVGVRTSNLTGNVTLDQNDVLCIRISGTMIYNMAKFGSFNVYPQAYVTAGSNITVSVPTQALSEGNPLSLNACLPKDIQSKELLLSIIRAFNLYVDVDPENEKRLIIEPLISFYSGQTIDWSNKLDRGKEISAKPVAEIEGKEYLFTFKQDKDYFNERYLTKYEEIYGQRKIEIQNDFVAKQKKYDVIFSPTPSVGNSLNSLVVPTILKRKEDGTREQFKPANIRLLYYGGLKSGDWTFKSDVVANETRSTYPYAGHLDDPYFPTLDLLFGRPQEIYWGSQGNIGSNYTTNNLYNRYWKQFIEEITDKDSKIATAYFRLRPIDIFNLDFRKTIQVDGVNYRLNRIIDYNPLSEESTKVELAKSVRGTTFSPGVEDQDNTLQNPRNFTLIEGGEDEVREVSAISLVTLIEGGEDEIRDLSATSTIFFINGGLD